LNNNYRKINENTDVLSFHYFDDFSLLNDDAVAGEIILSEEKIKSQAKEF
jgi:rRNA maturation RNase YbeY